MQGLDHTINGETWSNIFHIYKQTSPIIITEIQYLQWVKSVQINITIIPLWILGLRKKSFMICFVKRQTSSLITNNTYHSSLHHTHLFTNLESFYTPPTEHILHSIQPYTLLQFQHILQNILKTLLPSLCKIRMSV